jgi:cobaltochelatase CobT
MVGNTGELARLAGPLALLLLIILTWRALRRRGKNTECVPGGPEDEPYRIFTREHDLELSATDALKTLRISSPDFSKGWLQVDGSLSTTWAERTETMLREHETRFDELAVPFLEQFGDAVPASEIFVSILIDQSGSMKGEPIAFAAVTAALITQLLERLHVKCEILGFSTAGWHGGRAYQQWRELGRPKRPGRLCALRHVVYKSADERQLDPDSMRALVHFDLLRENVDGEAIAWARDRLLHRSEPHKLLIVISDGAPVDDATLKQNGPNYLYRHLMRVLANAEKDILIGAIGIKYRVNEYYSVSESVQSAQQLPESAIKLIARLFETVRIRAGESV